MFKGVVSEYWKFAKCDYNHIISFKYLLPASIIHLKNSVPQAEVYSHGWFEKNYV